jgi:leader peptidase (prepilin peptidase) / N-methyltransferase
MTQFPELLFLFLIGSAVGSFLLVIIDRLPRGESFISGRSHCDYCNHTLSWYDLFPVFSFITLQGKCRYCKKKLSIKYPLFELVTGLLFVLTYVMLVNQLILIGPPNQYLALPFYLFVVAALIVIYMIDLRFSIIPFAIVIPLTAVTFLFRVFATDSALLTYLLSGFGAFLFFLLLFLVTKGRGMGFGDVVYVFFMGLLLGFPGIVVGLYIAFLTGAAVSLILVVAKQKKLHGGTIPFGPFLVLGTYVSLLWGDQLFGFARMMLHF